MAHDPTASAHVTADWFREDPPSAPLLSVDDPGPIALALDDLGVEHHAWIREARAGAPATPWTPEGPFASAVVRLPKGREAQRMVLHAVVGRLQPDGVCFVHGHNAEGIKSARKPASEVFEQVEAVEARRHSRLWRCTGPKDVGRTALADWATEVTFELPDGPLSWTSWPGLFAHGRIDEGSQLLMAALPTFEAGSRLLDFAAGAGVLAKVLLRRNPGIAVDLLDIDALAVHAARKNVPEAGEIWLSDGFTSVPTTARWNAIVGNPPWHAGVATDWTALDSLVRLAPKRLESKGALWLVTQRNVPIRERLEEGFRHVRIAASTPGFRVWHATL